MSRLSNPKSAFAAALMTFVSGWEGVSYVAYVDVVGVLTICYGETKNVRPGEVRTQAQCNEGLFEELKVHEAGILKCEPALAKLPDGPYMAHVSNAYNIGIGGWCGSGMAKAVRAGNVEASCDALMRWNKGRIKGVLVPISGLTNRRSDERRVCYGGVPKRNGPAAPQKVAKVVWGLPPDNYRMAA